MDKKPNYFIIFLLFFTLSGCHTIPDLLDNPLYIDIATRQAVARYINAGETEADENARAAKVVNTVGRALEFLEGYPRATSQDLVSAVSSNITWESLSASDRFLVQDILSILAANLKEKQKIGLLDEDQIIRIRTLLNSIIIAAGVI